MNKPLSLSDAELIRRILDGESDVFEILMTRHETSLLRYVLSLINHGHDAQDITQDIWLSAYQHLNEIKNAENFKNWLYAIARNRCRYYLGRRVEPLQLFDDHTELFDPEDEHIRRARRRRVLNAVASLSQILRKTVTLYYITGYTCSEVSHRLNVPVGTVKRRLADARKQLKLVFNQWRPGSDSRWALDH